MFSKMNKTITVTGVALALMLAVTTLNTQTALASTERDGLDVSAIVREATDQGLQVTGEVTGDHFTNPSRIAIEQRDEVTGVIPFTGNDGDMRN